MTVFVGICVSALAFASPLDRNAHLVYIRGDLGFSRCCRDFPIWDYRRVPFLSRCKTDHISAQSGYKPQPSVSAYHAKLCPEITVDKNKNKKEI